MLEVNDVSKRCFRFQLNHISFHLPKGYIMGLIGANGAGKTTLIKTILDLYHADEGSILFNGSDMNQKEAEIKDRLGVILGGSDFYNRNQTARKNAQIFGPAFHSYEESVFLSYLHRFEVDPDQKLRHLSKGMMLKFQLAFALSHQAQLFIFDEPEDGLDQESRHEFMDILLELIQDGEKSVLMSTHITEDLDRIADYITYLKNGKVLFTTEKEVLCNRFLIVRAEEYKLRLLPSHLVLYSERGPYGSMALVVNSKMHQLDSCYVQERPTIQDLMYCIEKGGICNVEDFLE